MEKLIYGNEAQSTAKSKFACMRLVHVQHTWELRSTKVCWIAGNQAKGSKKVKANNAHIECIWIIDELRTQLNSSNYISLVTAIVAKEIASSSTIIDSQRKCEPVPWSAQYEQQSSPGHYIHIDTNEQLLWLKWCDQWWYHQTAQIQRQSGTLNELKINKTKCNSERNIVIYLTLLETHENFLLSIGLPDWMMYGNVSKKVFFSAVFFFSRAQTHITHAEHPVHEQIHSKHRWQLFRSATFEWWRQL